VAGAVAYANDYVGYNQRLPNIFLCSYPEYLGEDQFLAIRPFFSHVKGIGVEVGTFEGYNAVNVLKYCKLDKLYCVDPYRPYVDTIGGLGDFYQETWDAIHAKVVDRLGGMAEVIRKPSLDAVVDFSDSSLDFVYLDGDHSGDNVLKEIYAWLPKVKTGGLLGGHDCLEGGVMQAITEWNISHPEYDEKIYSQSNDWWLFKL
jgi:hypothetical protein